MSSVIPEILFLVKQIRPTTTQIYNLRAPIAVLLQARALEAVKGVRDAFATADDAFVLVVAEGALVANAGKGGRAHVGVAYGAFAVALVAEAADGDAGLLAAHYEIAALDVSIGAYLCWVEALTDDGETWRGFIDVAQKTDRPYWSDLGKSLCFG